MNDIEIMLNGVRGLRFSGGARATGRDQVEVRHGGGYSSFFWVKELESTTYATIGQRKVRPTALHSFRKVDGGQIAAMDGRRAGNHNAAYLAIEVDGRWLLTGDYTHLDESVTEAAGTHIHLSLDEARFTISKEDYGWGRLRKIRFGNSGTIVIHPNEWEDILALDPAGGRGSSLTYRDETGQQVEVERSGQTLTFTSRSGSADVRLGDLE